MYTSIMHSSEAYAGILREELQPMTPWVNSALFTTRRGLFPYSSSHNINGYTFLKLADFSKAGLDVRFNEEKKRIEVENVAVIHDEKGEGNLSNTTTEGENYNTTTVDGVEYISFKEIYNLYYDKGYNFGYNEKKEQSYFYYNPDTKHHNPNSVVILIDSIPTKIINGMSHIEYQYFQENILSLIK